MNKGLSSREGILQQLLYGVIFYLLLNTCIAQESRWIELYRCVGVIKITSLKRRKQKHALLLLSSEREQEINTS